MHSCTLSDLRGQGFSSQHCPITRQVMGNMARSFDGFDVSYNSRTTDYGCDTTTLVLQGRVFFVLNGNHAGAMIAAAEQNGIQGCIDLFIDSIQQANERSEHRIAVGVTASKPLSGYGHEQCEHRRDCGWTDVDPEQRRQHLHWA